MMTRCPGSWNRLGIQQVHFPEKKCGSDMVQRMTRSHARHKHAFELLKARHRSSFVHDSNTREREREGKQWYLNKFWFHAPTYLDRIMFSCKFWVAFIKEHNKQMFKPWLIDIDRFLPESTSSFFRDCGSSQESWSTSLSTVFQEKEPKFTGKSDNLYSKRWGLGGWKLEAKWYAHNVFGWTS